MTSQKTFPPQTDLNRRESLSMAEWIAGPHVAPFIRSLEDLENYFRDIGYDTASALRLRESPNQLYWLLPDDSAIIFTSPTDDTPDGPSYPWTPEVFHP